MSLASVQTPEDGTEAFSDAYDIEDSPLSSNFE
jgi:hypothetical protein